MTPLFLRALLAFLALPVVVAGLVPWWLLGSADRSANLVGLAVLALGVVLLLWCVRDFYVSGKGTLAPWDPPKRLVTTGLYRFSRNPMYVAVLTILAGWAVGFAARPLIAYALMMTVIFHLRVVYYEEPWLAQQFGAEWETFRKRVPRWLGPRRG
jgi:protein-S-isoprenylcysteine O-methyltransferase Ste14